MAFEKNTYLVLEIPVSDWTRRVLELRRGLDPWRATLPIEITLAGSGGVGVVSAGQDEGRVMSILETIASETAPIEVGFPRIRRFPESTIYYFEPSPSGAILDLHRRIAGSGIRFGPVQFPFEPHCTIVDLGQAGEWAVDRVLALPCPEGSVRLSHLALYTLAEGSCSRGRSFRLAGP